ncbi:MAG: hypothetical protein HOP15_16755 [Planctomycetes bacterium]|nr:hypothetical protein [Planctomycetota bacterium]
MSARARSRSSEASCRSALRSLAEPVSWIRSVPSSIPVPTARAVQSVRRVARTLADLEGHDEVAEQHLKEALALRAPLA